MSIPVSRLVMPTVLLLLVAGASPYLVQAGGPPPAADKALAAPAKAPAEAKDNSLEAMTIPDGAIVTVLDSMADALNRLPLRAVILTPKAHQELRAELDRLRRQAEKARPVPPSHCQVKGKVEGSLATLQAQFEFVTSEPGTLVSLGCAPALASGVSLTGKDGARVPQLLGGAPRRSGAAGPPTGRTAEQDLEGFAVRVDKPDRYQLTLDLLLTLSGPTPAARPSGAGAGATEGGANRSEGLSLELPRAAVTSLELDLPPGVREVRVNGKPLTETLTLKGNRLSGILGAVDRLEVTWKSARDAASAKWGPVVAADAAVQVRIDPREITTETRLTLQVLGGQVNQWRLLVPLKAEIILNAEDLARGIKVESTDQKNLSLRTLQLKEPTADPLTVTVTTTGPAPRSGLRYPVGPFSVLGAVRQTASVLVYSATPDLYPEFRLGASTDPSGSALVQRDLTAVERRDSTLVAAFRPNVFLEKGSALPEGPPAPRPGKPAGASARSSTLPWLELELESVRGQVKTRVEHLLELVSVIPDAPALGPDVRPDDPLPLPRGEAEEFRAERSRPGREGGRERRWRVQTSIQVTPRQSAFFGTGDRVLVRMPPGCEYVEEAANVPDKVRQVSYDRVNRVVEFKLHRASLPSAEAGATVPARSPLEPFTLTVEGVYPVFEEKRLDDKDGLQRLVLGLPRPEGTVEAGGEVKVVVPQNTEALLPQSGAEGVLPGTVGPNGLELVKQQPHELTWRVPRGSPGQVEVAWRDYRPEVRVTSVVDLALTARQGVVRQELRFHTKNPLAGDKRGPVTYTLRVPPGVRDSLRVVQGGALRTASANPSLRLLVDHGPDSPAGKPAGPLVLEYAFALPPAPLGGANAAKGGGPAGKEKGEASDLLAVPLVVPILAQAGVGEPEPTSLPAGEGMCPGEVRVRVWGEAGELPNLVPGNTPVGVGWTEQPIEEWVEGMPGPSPFVKGRLPALVLRAERQDLPLVLRRGEGKPVFAVLVDRALVQVEFGPGGVQHYRVRYRLGQMAERQLDLEMPAPVPTIGLQVFLGAQRIDHEVLSEVDEDGVRGRVARVRLPLLTTAGKPAAGEVKSDAAEANVLEVVYQLAPGRTGGGTLWTPLTAPVLRGSPGDVPTRWHVRAPANWVLVSPEADPGAERLWGLRGWLLAPRVGLNAADLERWLVGSEVLAAEAEADPEHLAGDDPAGVSQLMWWARSGGADPAGDRERPETVVLMHFPQQVWLLSCSLALLVLGLGACWLTGAFPGSAQPNPARLQARPKVAQLSFWGCLLLAGLALGAVTSALVWPTLVSQVVYGSQPGALVLVLILAVQWLIHERRRRRVVFLSSFSRSSGVRSGGSSTGRAGAGEPAAVPVPRVGVGEPSTVDAPALPPLSVSGSDRPSSANSSKNAGATP